MDGLLLTQTTNPTRSCSRSRSACPHSLLRGLALRADCGVHDLGSCVPGFPFVVTRRPSGCLAPLYFLSVHRLDVFLSLRLSYTLTVLRSHSLTTVTTLHPTYQLLLPPRFPRTLDAAPLVDEDLLTYLYHAILFLLASFLPHPTSRTASQMMCRYDTDYVVLWNPNSHDHDVNLAHLYFLRACRNMDISKHHLREFERSYQKSLHGSGKRHQYV